jgi:hypothetical protein
MALPVQKDIRAFLADQAEQGAKLAGTKLIQAIQNGTIAGKALVLAYGVLFDKAVIARGDASVTVRHEHFHSLRVQHDHLAKTLVAMRKREPLPVLDAKLLTDQPAQPQPSPKPKPSKSPPPRDKTAWRPEWKRRKKRSLRNLGFEPDNDAQTVTTENESAPTLACA